MESLKKSLGGIPDEKRYIILPMIFLGRHHPSCTLQCVIATKANPWSPEGKQLMQSLRVCMHYYTSPFFLVTRF